MTECIQAKSKKEKDEKVRCWFPFCNKLFKNLDFLKKHVVLKHDYFAADLILKNAGMYAYICMYLCMRIYVCLCTYVCVYVCMRMYVCMYVYMYVCI